MAFWSLVHTTGDKGSNGCPGKRARTKFRSHGSESSLTRMFTKHSYATVCSGLAFPKPELLKGFPLHQWSIRHGSMSPPELICTWDLSQTHLVTLHEQSGVSFSPEGSLRSKARLDSDAFHCLSLVTSSGVGTSCLSEVKSTEALSLFLDLLMQNLRHLTHPNLLLFIWGGKCQIVLINRKCVCVLFQVASKTFRKVQLGDGTQLSRRTFCSGMDLPGQEKWYRSGKSMGPLKGKISLFLGGHVKEPRELQYYSSH